MRATQLVPVCAGRQAGAAHRTIRSTIFPHRRGSEAAVAQSVGAAFVLLAISRSISLVSNLDVL